MNLKAPRGTKDILPEETAQRQYLEQVFSDICQRYGYREIRVPTFEHTDLFVRGVGDASDIVEEMYTFEDKGAEVSPCALRGRPVWRAPLWSRVWRPAPRLSNFGTT